MLKRKYMHKPLHN